MYFFLSLDPWNSYACVRGGVRAWSNFEKTIFPIKYHQINNTWSPILKLRSNKLNNQKQDNEVANSILPLNTDTTRSKPYNIPYLLLLLVNMSDHLQCLHSVFWIYFLSLICWINKDTSMDSWIYFYIISAGACINAYKSIFGTSQQKGSQPL